jgi:hypothetical protein
MFIIRRKRKIELSKHVTANHLPYYVLTA